MSGADGDLLYLKSWAASTRRLRLRCEALSRNTDEQHNKVFRRKQACWHISPPTAYLSYDNSIYYIFSGLAHSGVAKNFN